jgi:hypothetical protein
MIRWLAILSLFAHVAVGETLFRGRLLNPNTLHGSDRKQWAPKLWDERNGKLIPAEAGDYLADRVYLVQHQGEGKSVFALTDRHGKFPEPFEFFYPGSVVLGRQVGAAIPKDHYVLTGKFRWERTETPFREQLTLVLADLPYFRRVRFFNTEFPPH